MSMHSNFGNVTATLGLIIVFTLLLEPVELAPVAGEGVSGREMGDVMSYMTSYGYLPQKNKLLGEHRTKDELIRGILQLQELAGLEPTGKIDKETVKLIERPRCSLPDIGPSDRMRRRKRYSLHDTAWRKHDLTYRVLNASTNELSMYQVRRTVRRAFDMWSAVSPLRFTERLSGHADIMISFVTRIHGDGYPFDGRGDRIAHAFYPHDNEGLDGDIHFDDEEHWTLENPRKGTNFLWTAIHEIGHAIGIEHSWYRSAIMYPYYTGYKPDLKLDDDDIMAIQAKYGKNPSPTVPPTLNPVELFPGPSPCDVAFDAVIHSTDGNTYFFKEPFFWTLDKYNRSLGGGRKIVNYWPNLRKRVHAAYTRRDGKTVFFKGRRFWVFEGTKYIEGPKLIMEYGLPDELKRLDAAFTWGANGHTYFFKGDKYWRYNEKMRRIDYGYPKNISDGWGAVPYPVGAVMTGKDGNTYFFKGKHVSKFVFHKSHVYEPQKVGDVFFKCNVEKTEKKKSTVQVALEEKLLDERNGVAKTTVLIPVLSFISILVSFYNLS